MILTNFRCHLHQDFQFQSINLTRPLFGEVREYVIYVFDDFLNKLIFLMKQQVYLLNQFNMRLKLPLEMAMVMVLLY